MSTAPRRRVSFLLSHRPWGSVSYMACLFMSGIRSAGSTALSYFFWTLLPTPRTIPCLTLDWRSLRFFYWMISWMAIGTSCCFAPPGLLNQSHPPLITTFSLPCPGWRSDSENTEQKFFWKCELFFKLSSSIWFRFSCHWLNFHVNDQKHPKMYLYSKYIKWNASESENFVRREQTKLSLKSE